MSDLRTAAQQALEALTLLEKDIEWQIGSPTLSVLRKSRKALRAALAQRAEPVQESVHEHEDWCASVTQLLLCDPPRKAPCNCKHTAPPQRRPLTEEEIERIGMKHVTLREVIRAVERAHGIKE